MAYYPGATTGGGAPGSEFYPMSLMDYTPPEAMEGVGLEFQPWLQPENMPDSLWNYQAPTLDEWSTTPRNWDWALKDMSAKKDDDDDDDTDTDTDTTITDVDNIEKIKHVKSDFIKGKKEATAESVLNTLYGVDSGIWGSKERRRVNTPWVDPNSVVPNTQKMVGDWRNPDYQAPRRVQFTPPAPTAAVTPTAPAVDFATQQQRLIDESRERYRRNAPGARSRTNASWT